MTYTIANVEGRAALVADGHCYDLEAVSGGQLGPDPMAALAVPERLAALTAELDQHEPNAALASADLGPPVPRPRNVFAIGLNYQAHADEGSMDVPDNPLVFTKFPSCLVGPTTDVELRSDAVDYEGELVVVIGPGGPVMVSPDSVERDRLRIVTEVNGEVRQDGTTDEPIFDIPTLVSYLSRVTTLSTGDLIFTGTPNGIGAAQGKFLAHGDVITTRIDGIGTLSNRCVRTTDHHVC